MVNKIKGNYVGFTLSIIGVTSIAISGFFIIFKDLLPISFNDKWFIGIFVGIFSIIVGILIMKTKENAK